MGTLMPSLISKTPPTSLRGHHLLCVQRFKGLGYSPEFVANMAAVIERLNADVSGRVRLSDAPDEICRCCPHLGDGACRDDGEGAELKRAAQDRLALEAFGLTLGEELAWAEVLRRLHLQDDAWLSEVCGSCQWFQEGTCR